jgi:hypothetical protein
MTRKKKGTLAYAIDTELTGFGGFPRPFPRFLAMPVLKKLLSTLSHAAALEYETANPCGDKWKSRIALYFPFHDFPSPDPRGALRFTPTSCQCWP